MPTFTEVGTEDLALTNGHSVMSPKIPTKDIVDKIDAASPAVPIHGICVGGGLGIAALCDIRLWAPPAASARRSSIQG